MIICGDALTELRKMPEASVHCCVTSPPYWGLRDYGVAGQLGLEKTPEEYVANLVAVFREVKRALRDDGTLWLNLGDCYTSIGRSGRKESPGVGATQEMRPVARDVKWKAGGGHNFSWTLPGGQKPKDLVGIPWRVAFALQADGWYLRSDIIWAKPNPMPESVKDRPTRSHEYIFLMSKESRYYYDAEAIFEGFADKRMGNPGGGGQYAKNCPYPNAHEGQQSGLAKGEWNTDGAKSGRNRRSVWSVTTKPFSEAHFATFPPDLIEPCIKAGCPVGGTVLDPFFGSGTVGLVAARLGREFIGIELNPAYVEMAKRRIYGPMYQEFAP